ncbi:hypothetical protein ACMG4P_03475 [Pseudovibrio denitrificans]|uniref:hypothetical protein n=1 Tax=Pseudovibrio denitrificans TaxID=258256 RepID=UPI0039BF2F88
MFYIAFYGKANQQIPLMRCSGFGEMQVTVKMLLARLFDFSESYGKTQGMAPHENRT